MSDSTHPPRRSRLRRAWSALFGGLAALQRGLVHLVFLAVVAGAVAVWVSSRPAPLQEKTTLVLNLQGPLREQWAGGARDSALGQLQGQAPRQVRLRDVLTALDHARQDPQITRVLLKLDEFGGGGLASLGEVAAALERFKAAGKTVVAWGHDWDQRAYYLAAHASQVWLHPMGTVMVEGYGRQRNYYKDALDKLGVQANVIRVGKYKNAGEPYFASGPSKETLESEAHVLDALWLTYRRTVEKARGLPDGALPQAIDSLPDSLIEAGGNAAQWALQQKWVDALKTQDQMRQALIESGAADERKKTFRQVSFAEYLRRVPSTPSGPGVAIVVAEGEIGDGQAPSGRVGGDSTSALIRNAREDERVKAVVLRVNSPGGSAFASEQIRRELELTRAAGKPVVVSMGDVAASGGYWMAMAADEVVADPSTITGSIGVFGMLPTAQALIDKTGVRTGGHRTTWLVGAYDFRRDLDPRFAKLVQASIGHIYEDFTTKAAAARGTTREAIDAVAQGRIWTGEQAKAHGLIDRTGGLQDAVRTARERAKLADEAPVRYLEKAPGAVAQVLQSLGVQAWVADRLRSAWADALGLPPGATVSLQMLQGPAEELVWLSEVMQSRSPFAAVVHCLCEPPR